MPVIAQDLEAQHAWNVAHPLAQRRVAIMPPKSLRLVGKVKRKAVAKVKRKHQNLFTEFYLPIVYLRFCGWSNGLVARELECSVGLVSRVMLRFAAEFMGRIPTLHEIERKHGGCENVGRFWEHRVATGLFEQRFARGL